MSASSSNMLELLAHEPKPKKITSTLIRYPETGVEYRMYSDNLEQVHKLYPAVLNYVAFQFDISLEETIASIDLLSCTYKVQHKEDQTFFLSVNKEGVFGVNQKTLPVYFRDFDFPMLYYYGNPNELHFVTAYKLSINNDTISQTASRAIINIQDNPLYTLNELMRTEYSRQLGAGITVHTTEYPIFKSCNPLCKEELDMLFNKFIINNYKLLKAQYESTEDKCHIRAHFINYCLRAYGIDSYKIFKFWDIEDWSSYEDNKGWSFHCAAFIRDSDGNDWVWDPWETSATELVSPREWITRTDQPMPKGVMITPGFMVRFPYCPLVSESSNTLFASRITSRYPSISRDDVKDHPNDFKAFQAMYGSVAKLAVEKNFGNPYALFQPVAREPKLLKYHPTAAVSSCPEEPSPECSSASCSRF